MNGNTIIWLSYYLVATWLCSICLSAGSISVSPEAKMRYQYPLLKLNAEGLTADSYSKFIDDLRSHLTSGEARYGIPIMRSRQNSPMSERVILVQLTNLGGEVITLAIDVVDAYVIGYRAGDSAFFFRPEDNSDVGDVIPVVFTDSTTRQTFRFTGAYGNLGNRSAISLGYNAINQAISVVYNYREGDTSDLTRSLLVCIQMISEAARFRYIEYEMRRRITNGDSDPDASVIRLENAWGRLSDRIQSSTEGAFQHPVRLDTRTGETRWVDNVAEVISIIALLNFCSTSSSSSPYLLSRVKTPHLVSNGVDDPTCEQSEPTVRISGPNGLCVDVRDGSYHNGNSIQLWPCKSNSDVNQLWTFKRDGTVRSNGKCLSGYGHTTGDHVMIYDCPSTHTDEFYWEVWENGTMIAKTGLVLASKSATQGNTLTVEAEDQTTGQSWLPSNNTQPMVAAIVGLKDLCMQASGCDIWLDKCVDGKAEQEWAIYADGSIRPKQDRKSCLSATVTDWIVTIVSCDLKSLGQRWVFRNDGTILNLHSGLVMDVAYSDIRLKRIIIYGKNGNPNQNWFLLF